jgi:DNA-binding transcriptional MocR family regulator
VCERPNDIGRFQMVPEWVVERVDFNAHAVLVYVWLGTRYWKCDGPTRQTLAGDLGLSVKAIERALQVLRDAGAILTKKRYDAAGHIAGLDYVIVTAISLSDSPVVQSASLSDSPVAQSQLSDSPVAQSTSLSDSPVVQSASLSDSPVAQSQLSDSPVAQSQLSDSPVAQSTSLSDSPVVQSASLSDSPVAQSQLSDSPVATYKESDQEKKEKSVPRTVPPQGNSWAAPPGIGELRKAMAAAMRRPYDKRRGQR